MELDSFVRMISKSTISFHHNMINLELAEKKKTKEEWMDMYIRWMEWKTDMHKEYWGE